MFYIEIQIVVVNKCYFDVEDYSTVLHDNGTLKYTLHGQESKSIANSDELTFCCDGFLTQLDAEKHQNQFAYYVRYYLTCCGITYSIKMQIIKKHGAMYAFLHADFHCNASVSIALPKMEFDIANINDKAERALGLYEKATSSNLPDSFLFRFMVIEALATQQQRSANAIALIKKFEDEISDSDLLGEEKDQLLGGAQNLRNAGTTNAARQLVRDFCGEAYMATFNSCSKLRGKIAHSKPCSEQEMIKQLVPLDELVKLLIKEYISKSK